MKVYITKYWHARGIIEAEAEVCFNVSSGMIKTDEKYPNYIHKPWWHETLEAAKVHAEQQRLKKIKALQKQIAKLEQMTF